MIAYYCRKCGEEMQPVSDINDSRGYRLLPDNGCDHEVDMTRLANEQAEEDWAKYAADGAGMDLTSAIMTATAAHDGQKYGTMPYIFHPLAVAEGMVRDDQDSELVVVGVLHDVIEDTRTTLHDLMRQGINRRQRACLELMTKDDTEPYMDYIRRIAEDDDARLVKQYDMRENIRNLNDLRYKFDDPKKAERLAVKYGEAFTHLRRVEFERGLRRKLP